MDETRFLENEYYHQSIDLGNAHEKAYFHISAPDLINLHIGFSNGYTDHNDAKWEAIAGGANGIEFVIRKRNWPKGIIYARNRYPDRTKWEEVRDNFAVQVRDGNIAIYSADSDGIKKEMLAEWNDDTIVKSDLNTLTMAAGFGGSGNVRIRGVCEGNHYCSMSFENL